MLIQSLCGSRSYSHVASGLHSFTSSRLSAVVTPNNYISSTVCLSFGRFCLNGERSIGNAVALRDVK
jgi:hypothetical protein